MPDESEVSKCPRTSYEFMMLDHVLENTFNASPARPSQSTQVAQIVEEVYDQGDQIER